MRACSKVLLLVAWVWLMLPSTAYSGCCYWNFGARQVDGGSSEDHTSSRPCFVESDLTGSLHKCSGLDGADEEFVLGHSMIPVMKCMFQACELKLLLSLCLALGHMHSLRWLASVSVESTFLCSPKWYIIHFANQMFPIFVISRASFHTSQSNLNCLFDLSLYTIIFDHIDLCIVDAHSQFGPKLSSTLGTLTLKSDYLGCFGNRAYPHPHPRDRLCWWYNWMVVKCDNMYSIDMDDISHPIDTVPWELIGHRRTVTQILDSHNWHFAEIAYHGYAMREVSVNSTSLYETN